MLDVEFTVMYDPHERGDWSAYQWLNTMRLSRFETLDKAKLFCQGISEKPIQWEDHEAICYGRI